MEVKAELHNGAGAGGSAAGQHAATPTVKQEPSSGMPASRDVEPQGEVWLKFTGVCRFSCLRKSKETSSRVDLLGQRALGYYGV